MIDRMAAERRAGPWHECHHQEKRGIKILPGAQGVMHMTGHLGGWWKKL